MPDPHQRADRTRPRCARTRAAGRRRATTARGARRQGMRPFALMLLAGAVSLVAAPLHPLAGQGFGVYEHNTCTMGRGGVTAARPCADGSAIYFNPAGLAGLSGTHVSVGVTLIGAQGN